MLYGWSTLTKYMQTIAKGEDGPCLLIKLTVKKQHFGIKIRAKSKKSKRKRTFDTYLYRSINDEEGVDILTPACSASQQH